MVNYLSRPIVTATGTVDDEDGYSFELTLFCNGSLLENTLWMIQYNAALFWL